MPKWKLFSLAIFANCSSLFAQNNFQPGYIVDLQGDTLVGSVDLEDVKNSFKRCRFKQGGRVSQFEPKEIRGFAVYGRKAFVSGLLPEQFTEVLVLGTLSLYKGPDSYVITKNKKQFELRSKPVEQVVGGQRVLVDNKWRGLLTSQIGDCLRNPAQRMASLRFNDKAIGKVVEDYNECLGAPYVTIKSDLAALEIRPVFSAGIDFSTPFVLQSENYPSFLPDRFSAITPGLGIGAMATFPRFSERVSLQLEALLRFGSYDETVVTFLGGDQTRTHEVGFELVSVVMPLTFSYNLPIADRSLQIQAGFHVSQNLKRSTYWNWQSTSRGRIFREVEQTPFEIGTFGFGPQGGFTYWMNLSAINLGIRAQYHYTFQSDGSPELVLGIGNTSIGLIVKLGKKG